MHSRVITTALLSALALGLGSCVIPAQEALKNSAGAPQNQQTAAQGDGAGGQGLIKPMIPPDAPPGPIEAKPEPKVQQQQPIRVVVDRSKAPEVPRQKWEDQKIKDAALEMAKSIPNVRGIKLCLKVKTGEWWVTYYEDIGSLLDLRQFVWSPDQDRFQPHLVQVRIAKSALERHLTESEPDQACESLQPPAVPRSAVMPPPGQEMPADIPPPNY
jgi:hypothetical protein